MKRYRIPCLPELTLLLAALVAGCSDDRGLSATVATVTDAGAGDAVDGPVDSSRADARRDAAVDRSSGGGGGNRQDASSRDRPPDRPRDSALREVGPDRPGPRSDGPDAAVSDAGGPDAPEPDAPPDQAPDAPPDAAPDTDPGVVMPTDNCRTACASLFDLTAACSVEDEACTTATVDDTGGTEVRNICYDNGIQKVATETSPSSSGYAINLVVKRSDGTTCYTVDVLGEDGEPATWTFKAPGGAVLGRAIVSDDETLMRCEASGLTFDISNASNCSGMEGEGTCEPNGPATCPQ